MAQFGRPSSDITTTNITGTFADVDETTASDTDFIVSTDNTVGTYETLLSSVTDPLSSTGHIVRVRHAKADTNVPPSTTGNAVSADFTLYEGATLRATLATAVALGAWTDLSYTLTAGEADAITNYADLRVRMVTTNSGGSPANRRGGAISWIEFECPDAVATTKQRIMITG